MAFRLLFIMTFSLLLVAAYPSGMALSQDSLFSNRQSDRQPPFDPITEIYEKLPVEEQQRLMDEMQYVYDYCNKRDLFSSLHDCRCVAMKFLDERLINYDPTRSPVAVADDVADQCPSEVNSAGYAYTKCVDMYGRRLPVGLEEFCTCYANNFAKLYMKDPRAYIPNLTAIGGASLQKCSEKHENNPLDSPLIYDY